MSWPGKSQRSAGVVLCTALVLLVTGVLATPLSSPAEAETGRTVTSLLSRLDVRQERSSVPYDRSLYPHWVDEDGDGCDTRREVLAEEATVPLEHCRQQAGTWVSVYDGEAVSEAIRLDIDHVVALAEAHRSGADRWDRDRRTAFANDLGSPWSLVAVTAASNRSKSDRDLARWQPSTPSGRCFLAQATVITKWRWRLSVDRAELNALRRELRSCPAVTVTVERIPAKR